MKRETKSLINLFVMLGAIAGATLFALFLANRLLAWVAR